MNISTLVASLLLLEEACLPLGDLDAAGSGKAAGGSVGSTTAAGASGTALGSGGRSGSWSGAGAGALGAMSGGAVGGITDEPGMGGSAGVAGDGPDGVGAGPAPDAGSGGAASGVGGAPTGAGQAGAAATLLPDLPNELPNSPVQGNVSCVEASFLQQPTFEVHTPMATIMVRRQFGDIISILDRLSSPQVEWLGYNDFRPQRTAGVLTESREHPRVTTSLDANSLTARHVRLRSQSTAGDWAWVWDFYATQATLTISRTPGRFGFLYSGTPGGQLDDADQIVFASGVTESAKDSFLAPFPRAGAWLYFADPALRHSLFLIQHTGGSLSNQYDAIAGDSATFFFGDGAFTQVPSRFSLGLVNGTDLRAVTDRVAFVIAAVQ